MARSRTVEVSAALPLRAVGEIFHQRLDKVVSTEIVRYRQQRDTRFLVGKCCQYSHTVAECFVEGGGFRESGGPQLGPQHVQKSMAGFMRDHISTGATEGAFITGREFVKIEACLCIPRVQLKACIRR